MKYISLGDNCSVAYNIKRLTNQESYPFDWISNCKMNLINKLIENNFEGYLDIRKHKLSSNHPLFDSLNNMIDDSSYIIKNKYNINMPHYVKEYTDEEIIKFKELMNRRIERFYNIIDNYKEKIIFIRYETNKILQEDIDEFIRIIKNRNNELDFELKIITNKSIILQNCKIIEDKTKFENWKRENFDWLYIIESFC